MPAPTNYDLAMILARIEERQIGIDVRINAVVKWQESHEDKDTIRFDELNKYGRSIAIVASLCGAVIMLCIDAIRKSWLQ